MAYRIVASKGSARNEMHWPGDLESARRHVVARTIGASRGQILDETGKIVFEYSAG